LAGVGVYSGVGVFKASGVGAGVLSGLKKIAGSWIHTRSGSLMKI